jgi:hypothetical protein
MGRKNRLSAAADHARRSELGATPAGDFEVDSLGPDSYAVDTSRDALVEPGAAELPLGRSADPVIDASLSRNRLPQDETSGAALLGDAEEPRSLSEVDLALGDVWSSSPDEAPQSEGYDAVSPEDLGAVWIERATQTSSEHRSHASPAEELSPLEDLMSQGSRDSARAADDRDEDLFDEEASQDEAPSEDEEIADEDLDPAPAPKSRP